MGGFRITPKLQEAIPLLLTPNRRPVRGHRRLELVILHATGKGGLISAVDWLRNARRKNRTSAHYVIGRDGAIVQLAPERDITWHAGHGHWAGWGRINSRSIGIELVNRNDGSEGYPLSQLEACMWLCVRAARKHRRRPEQVVGHADVDPRRKTDPFGFPWTQFRASMTVNLSRTRRGSCGVGSGA